MIKIIVATTSMMLLLMSNAYAGSFLEGDGVGSSGDYAGMSSGVARRDSSLTDRNGASSNLYYSGTGIPLSAFVGRQYGVGLRMEGELFYKSDSADRWQYAGVSHSVDSRVWSLGVMGNLYYDFYHDLERLKDLPFSPYAGFGIGCASLSVSGATVNALRLWNDGQGMVFAYQAVVGSSFPVSKKILLDVSYRYFGTSSATIDQINVDYVSHNFLIGVRYLFR